MLKWLRKSVNLIDCIGNHGILKNNVDVFGPKKSAISHLGPGISGIHRFEAYTSLLQGNFLPEIGVSGFLSMARAPSFSWVVSHVSF